MEEHRLSILRQKVHKASEVKIMKLLSIIVPIYNAEKYLRACLNTLVNQTYKNKEIILIDDGSTDASDKICDDYTEQYSFVKVVHKQNGGVVSARNMGLELAKGDYIAFVDNDDELDLDMYQIMLHGLEQTKSQAAFCLYIDEYGDFKVKNRQTAIHTPQLLRTNKDAMLSIFQKGIGGFLWNKVFRRDAVMNVRFSSDCSLTDDLDFVWRTLKNVSSVCIFDMPMYHYRFSFLAESKASGVGKCVKALNVWAQVKRDLDEAGWTDEVIIYWVRSWIAWNIKVCEKMLLFGSFDENIYKMIQDNLAPYQKYFKFLGIRHRILVIAVMKSWERYSFWGRLVYDAKKTYVKIKQIKQ